MESTLMRSLVLTLGLAGLMGACSSPTAPDAAVAPEMQEIEAAPDASPAEVDEVADDADQVPAEADQASESDGDAEDMSMGEHSAAASMRTGIVATDPSTVVLASGQPQLVEFYADW